MTLRLSAKAAWRHRVRCRGICPGVVPQRLPVCASPRAEQRMPLIFPSVCEVDVVAGLEPVAREELRQRFGAQIAFRVTRPSPTGPTNIQFSFAGDPAGLTALRTVVAVYLVHHVSV